MEKQKDYRVICAWCNTIISEGHPNSNLISHGMCLNCSSKLLTKSPKKIKSFLDHLESPVIVMQDSVRALYANSAAVRLLGKGNFEIAGELGGDVFECIHSREPGGCGMTQHCKACTIRLSVEHTMSTGESLFDVPATLKRNTSEGEYKTSSLITTVRKKNKEGKAYVYLTIRDFKQIEE